MKSKDGYVVNLTVKQCSDIKSLVRMWILISSNASLDTLSQSFAACGLLTMLYGMEVGTYVALYGAGPDIGAAQVTPTTWNVGREARSQAGTWNAVRWGD